MYCRYCGTSLQIGTNRCPACKMVVLPNARVSSTSHGSPSSNVFPLEQDASPPQGDVATTPTQRLPFVSSSFTTPQDAIDSAITLQLPISSSPDAQKMSKRAKQSVSLRERPHSKPLPTAQPPARIRVIISVAIVIVVLVSIELLALSALFPRKAANLNAQLTPTIPLSQAGYGPSKRRIVTTAAHIIADPQIAAQMDNNYHATQITHTFTNQQTIYIIFMIDSQGKKGYIQAIWYANNLATMKNSFAHDPNNTVGYFSAAYQMPADGAIELSWCLRSDCQDAQLAQVIRFTVVLATSATPTTHL